ncbi:hypothetical protein ACJ72_03686 [Emergomyces africanus]|uniref:Uncharacterized protein n=1 Tax=Emergomyces africanus TaxID=1955775 RepID=A0A1B7NYW7_9EURO|nr:hypothetical protein ACJ72_03686 [Emergomyces africanus]
MADLVREQYRMEPLDSIIAGEPKSVNTNDESSCPLFSQTHFSGLSDAPQNSSYPANVVHNIAQTDGRSEICVSPSWQTDRQRREKKKELKRIAREKKELDRSLKPEPKNRDQSPFNEPRRLTKKQPVKTPSRTSSIRNVLPRSSTAPSILGFWSNSASKANSVHDNPGSDILTPEMGDDGAQEDTTLEPKKPPLFTGHLPQRFGGRINREPAYDQTSSRALDSNTPLSIPSSPSDIPRRNLHMAKKHSDLRAAARAFRSSDSESQNTNSAPTRSSWSQELTRRLSNSNGKKLQRRSVRKEHEAHMYSSRRPSANMETENGTKVGQKTEKSLPRTPANGHFHVTPGISSSSSQYDSTIIIAQSDEKIPPQDTINQQDCEESAIPSTDNEPTSSCEQEEPSTPKILTPSTQSAAPTQITQKPPESHRKHGRRHSWSEILNNSDRISGVYLKRRVQAREPTQGITDGDVHEFKTSGPYESTYAPNGVFNNDAAKSDPSITPLTWRVTARSRGIAGDFAHVHPQTESLPNATPTEVLLDSIDIQKPAPVTDSQDIELVAASPSVKQHENTIRMVPKILNRDVPFKSSPLAGPPLNNQDVESALVTGQIPKQGDNTDAPVQSNDGKSGFSFSRILRQGSKKEKSSASVGRRSSIKARASMLVNSHNKVKEPKASMSGSNMSQKQQDTEDKTGSKPPNSVGVKPEDTSRPASAFARQYNMMSTAKNEKPDDIKIPPKSPKRNSGIFPTPTSTRPSSANDAEVISISSNGTEKPSKKKRSISVDVDKSHVSHELGKERYNNKSTSGRPSPTLSSTQSTPINSSFPFARQPPTHQLAPYDPTLKTPDRYQHTLPGSSYDSRPSSSSRYSLSNSLGNGRAAAQRPARKGTPVAKMFVICCQCRYWHDMPSDVYAKLAFPNGIPPIEPIIGDDSQSQLHQPQLPMTSNGGFVSHGGGSSSTFTETSSATSNHALDNKSPRGSRPSSSSSSCSSNFMVTCCWCAHRMVKTCCAGWTTIVYLHERHH